MGSQLNHQKQMARQFFRLAAISGSIFIITLLILLALLTWIYSDRVKEEFLHGMNQHLNTEIAADNIRLNLFRNFPMGSLDLDNVSIMAAGHNLSNADTLLKAGSVYLQFNIPDLIRKDYTIRQIAVSDGSLNAAIHKDGRPDYIFWETSGKDVTRPFRFGIDRFHLSNLDLSFTDYRTGHHISATMEDLELDGIFTHEVQRMAVNGALHLHHLHVGDYNLPEDIPMSVDLGLIISEDEEWQFRESSLTYDGHDIHMEGTLKGTRDGLHVDGRIKGNHVDAAAFLQDMPESLRNPIAPYQPAGTIWIDATLLGTIGENTIPHINATFSISDGALSLPENNIHLQTLDAEGSYTNGNRQDAVSSRLQFEHIRASVPDGQIIGQLAITNFHRPHLTFDMEADMTTDHFPEWFSDGVIAEAGGQVLLDIRFDGQTNEEGRFTSKELLAATLNGEVKAHDVRLILDQNKSLPYQNLQADMVFHNNRLEIQEFSGMVGESSFSLSGHMSNVLPYLFLPDEEVFINANLKASTINLDELLKKKDNRAETTYRLQFPERLRLHMQTDIDSLTFRRFRAQQLKGSVRLQNQQLFADHLDFQTMDGYVTMQGHIDASLEEPITITCNAQLDEVDIHQLFYQTGNFGQESIVDENIYGDVTADMFFSANWSPELAIDWESMETTARLVIENGQLVNYKPMMAMGRFLRTDDLSNVSFSNLKNRIHIKDRLIVIPEMEISSSALDLKLSGEHSFKNEIDYRMQVLLSDLLARKHREQRSPQEEYGEIIDDGLGRTTLFLKLTGTASDPVFGYDHAGVREKLREDLSNERDNLIRIMRDEFSFLTGEQNDTIPEPPDEREEEMERIKQQEEGEFIIEWEEFEKE